MNTNRLGSYLHDLRKSHGYTQEYIASHLHIIHQTYSHYENGRVTPPADLLYILARLYKIPVENFLQLTVPIDQQEDIASECFQMETAEERNEFIAHTKENVRYRYLSPKEKHLLYEYKRLNGHNQDKVIDMLRMELKHQKKHESYETHK